MKKLNYKKGTAILRKVIFLLFSSLCGVFTGSPLNVFLLILRDQSDEPDSEKNVGEGHPHTQPKQTGGCIGSVGWG